MHFIDNLDPLSFETMLAKLPLATTRFVAISKSGGTAETLMQTIAALSALKLAGLDARNAFLGISEPVKAGKRNGLRDLLGKHQVTMLDHDPGVGGRFAALTNVGLLPTAALGLDIAAVRKGAAAALAPVLAKKKAAEVPAALGAALAVSLAETKGKSISVLMAYADRLERFTHWYVQLWAESLGKNGKGTTPVAALGPVDQHSQVQLFIGGPRDKLFTIVTVAGAGLGPRIDGELAKLAGEPGLGGKTIGDLVAAEARATAETLAKNGCPVRTIQLAEARRGGTRRTADAFHAGDHHRRALARRRRLRPAGGGRGQGAGEEVFDCDESSSPAKAGDPVRNHRPMFVYTGCPALAGHDRLVKCTASPTPSRSTTPNCRKASCGRRVRAGRTSTRCRRRCSCASTCAIRRRCPTTWPCG